MKKPLREILTRIHPEKVVVATAGIAILASLVLHAAAIATKSPGLRRAGFVAFFIALGISCLPLTAFLVVLGIDKLRGR